MQVAVIGAGIVGVTTAFELAELGHEVTVLERRGSVAAETSYANAGVIAPGYVTPWASPGMASKLLWQLTRRDSPVRLQWPGTVRHLGWLWQWWRACRPEVWSRNRQAMQRLAHFSRDRLLELTRTLGLEYDQMPGYVVLLRGPAELKGAQGGLALLAQMGVPHEVIDADRCRHLEPGLNPNTPLQAAIHLPQDGVGNCRRFAHLLKTASQQKGVHFRFDTAIDSAVPGHPAGAQGVGRPSLRFAGGAAAEPYDAIVICAGVQSNALLRDVGLKLPLVPVHGYSVTAPLRHVDGLPSPGPRAAVMDERFKVAISRLGQRIRIAGSAELGGRGDRIAPQAIRTLYRVLDDWFPGAAMTREAQHWKGARPMLPDGPPVLGESGAPGVWLNLGHGSSGWALACGSARVLAERISGREAPLDLSGLTVDRLR
ncbi:MAG: D-amino acid dehydrogenase [Rubrivivax sp.]